ncbi:MAG: hypothetical protein ACRCT8_07870 [Lacipirellulaceae bacterium]
MLVVVGGRSVVADEVEVIDWTVGWSYNVQDMQSLRDIDCVVSRREVTISERKQSHFWAIRDVLYGKQRDVQGNPTGPRSSFLVNGRGAAALANAARVFSEGVDSSRPVSGNAHSVVVFGYESSGLDFRIASVECGPKRIDVRYFLERRSTMDSKSFVAIIPVSERPVGRGSIALTRVAVVDRKGQPASPPPREYDDLLSGNSTFTVMPGEGVK